MKKLRNKVFITVFDNDVDALNPEVWAQESLMILENRLLIANLVHRDFEDEIAQYGDTVNADLPAKFQAKRKTANDDVTIQDATTQNVPVVMDQHIHTSFLIRDGQESLSFQNLVNKFLNPAILSIAEELDQVLYGEVYGFLGNSSGRLGTDVTKASIIDSQKVANDSLMPTTDRNLILTTGQYATLENIDFFMGADTLGDDGTALKEGSLGRKYGWNTFWAQQCPQIASSSVAVGATGAVDEATGYNAGDTAITVDGFSAAIANGTWCTIAGDDTPQIVTATVGGATPTQLTISPGLKRDIVDDAVVTIIKPALVNFGAGYASGYLKEMVIDNATTPVRGQLASLGVNASRYGLIETPDATGITMNKALADAAANDSVVGLGPSGSYGFGFHKNALALVTRPLALPREGTGALSSVVNYNGLSIRVVITYDGTKQGHLVTVDLLCGVKTLDTNLGMVLLG